MHSLTSPNPFLDPRLLLNRNFAIGLLIAFFMGMLAYTSLVLFPSLLHDLRGAEKQRLRPEDLLARFEDVRRTEQLDESAASLLRRAYV